MLVKKVVQSFVSEAYIVAGRRTPIGCFMGKLSHLKGCELGAIAIKAAMKDLKMDPNLVDEVIMGNVC